MTDVRHVSSPVLLESCPAAEGQPRLAGELELDLVLMWTPRGQLKPPFNAVLDQERSVVQARGGPSRLRFSPTRGGSERRPYLTQSPVRIPLLGGCGSNFIRYPPILLFIDFEILPYCVAQAGPKLEILLLSRLLALRRAQNLPSHTT